jgi:PAS domain S-box-containing protein
MELRAPFAFEERIVRKDGEERVLLSQGHPVLGPDDSLQALVGVCHDITDRAQMARALGNSERRLGAIVDNTPSVITVKDLDGCYVMGNAEASRVFGVSSEDLVGKTCAELFPPEVSEAQRANDRLAAAEGEPVYDELTLVRDGSPRNFLTVTFSLPDDEGRPAEICTIATDVTEGREREGERLERTTWTRRIESAVEEERLLVFAQPIVDLATNEVVSQELLVRMLTAGDRPQVLDPGTFLPPAERYGLIQKIDCWMVRQALELPGDLQAHVNLSAITMCDPLAREEIVAALRAHPERANRTVFEITETAVPEHFEAACGFAELVTALGARLALDDFGTGFGSLTYLNSLPVSFIKVDRSFVRDLASAPANRRMVESIVGIAGVFGLRSVAEGAEDQETIDLLREIGADYAQGFHLGRPAPVSAPPRPGGEVRAAAVGG